MDRLLKLKSRQLRRISQTIFNTFHARSADLYRPDSDYEGNYATADEQAFAEMDEDVAGTLRQEETPLKYNFAGSTKIVACDADDQGKLTLARRREANEFEPGKTFRFLIRDPEVPKQSVLIFERTVDFGEDDATQMISLIKVDELPAGQLPIAGVIHVFSYFHGDLDA